MVTYYHVSIRERTITETYKSLAPFGSRSLCSLEESKEFISNNEVNFKKEMNRMYYDYELTPVKITLLKNKK